MPPKRKAETQAAAPARAHARRFVDTFCPLKATVVDEYDVMLNQTNIGANNNKYYVIQLLHAQGSSYHVWNRWGRVGEPGQNQLHGPMPLAEAVANFSKKFKDKTSNDWAKRDAFVSHAGKYSIVKLKTAVDEPEPEPAAADEAAPKGKDKKATGKKKIVVEPPVTKLGAPSIDQQEASAAAEDVRPG